MFPYFGILLPPAFMAIMGIRGAMARLMLFPMFVTLALFIGLRDKVGMDWNNYLAILQTISGYTFSEAVSTSEPGFTALALASVAAGFHVYGVNLFAAVIFCIGLFSACRTAREPWLALISTIPYLVIVVAMSAIRQSIALGIIFLLVSHWPKFSILRKATYVLIASLFHISAIFLLVFVVMEAKLSPARKFILVVVFGGFSAYVLSTTGHLQYYNEMYLNLDSAIVESPGALAHVLLNAVPAGIYFLVRRVWAKAYGENRLLFMMSFLSLASVPAALVWSTAVDRMSLYLSSVPLLVYGGLPHLLSFGIVRTCARALIIVLNVAVLIAWLNYANSASAYLPYNNVLF